MKGACTMDLTFLSPESSECFSYAFVLFNISKLDSQVESTQIFSSVAPRGCIHPARALFSLWPFSFTRYKAFSPTGRPEPVCLGPQVLRTESSCGRDPSPPACLLPWFFSSGVFAVSCLCCRKLPELHPLSSLPSREAWQVKVLG